MSTHEHLRPATVVVGRKSVGRSIKSTTAFSHPEADTESFEAHIKCQNEAYIKEVYEPVAGAHFFDRQDGMVEYTEPFDSLESDKALAKSIGEQSSRHRNNADLYPTPLDLLVLACVLQYKNEGLEADRHSIVGVSEHMTGERLNLAPTYNSVDKLLNAGLLEEVAYNKDVHGGRKRMILKINRKGYEVLRHADEYLRTL